MTFQGSEPFFSGHVLGNIIIFANALTLGTEAIIHLLSLPAFILGVSLVALIEEDLFDNNHSFLSISIFFSLLGALFYLFDGPLMKQILLLATAFGMGMLHATYERMIRHDDLTGIQNKGLQQVFSNIKNSLRPMAILNSFHMIVFFLLGSILGAVSALHFGPSSLMLAASMLALACLIFRAESPYVQSAENVIKLKASLRRKSKNEPIQPKS